ncbi:MAG: hypothetical protein ACUVV3_09750 [Dehalococcoidia bacterium]
MAKLIGLLGIAGAVTYWAVWTSTAAAEQSPNTAAYVWLGLVTLPLTVVAAVGYAWAPAQPRWGGALVIFSGALLALWGAFITIDIGPGWFFAGLAVLAGGFGILRRRAPSAR